MEDIAYYTAHCEEPVFSLVPDCAFPAAYGEKGLLKLDAERRCESGVLVSFRSGIMSNAVPAHAEALLRLPAGPDALEAAGGAVERGPEEGLWKVSAEGIAAHAATPEGSESAEVKLAEILLRSGVLDEAAASLMEACAAFFGDYYGAGLNIAHSDPEFGRLTHVGGVASYQDGVFRQNINIRYSVTARYEDLVERIRETMGARGFEITRVENNGPNYVDPSLPVVRKLTEISNRVLGTDARPVVMGGGTYARKLRQAIAFGMNPPARRMPFGSTRGDAHQPDEHMDLEDLKKAVAVYVESIPAIDEILEA